MGQRVAGEFAGTDRFHVLGRIGAGGMGIVYEARDAESGQRVAVKTLKHLDARSLLRFKTEFRALADLSHPNLVSLGELIEVDGEWFFTMELVRGVDFMQYVHTEECADGDTFRDTLRDALRDTLRDDTAPTTDASAEEARGASVVPRAAAYVRVSFDETRLRLALVQLARGLCALHDAGKVHRDIKPANIRVTPEHRVVILDFGLVADLKPSDHTTDAHMVGTAAYMAPEQAVSHRVGPEADWYAMGVLLYQALVGRLPFVGAPLQVLFDKQRLEPPPPRTIVPSVPRDLDALCRALLSSDPHARPAGREVLSRLGANEIDELAVSTAASGHAPPFVGRRHELRELAQALQDAEQASAVTVLVEGDSGVGKTALVRRFVDETKRAEPHAVVLAGRCYERESVPYKAFDGVVDALSRFMTHLEGEEAGALLPRQAGVLAQIFPVLRRVKAFAKAAPPRAELDPQELRARLFSAVRETMGRLADRYPLVLVIDDLHWADNDSLALLAEVLRQPDAPTLLLIATLRPRGRERAAAIAPEGCRQLRLGSLSAEEGRELAQRLLGPGSADEAKTAADIAREAGGHPLFIDELVRYAEKRGGETAKGLHLDEALLARIGALSDAARTLLEVAAISGGPLAQTAALRASALAPPEFAGALAVLRAERLVRTTGMRGTDIVEPYHDRVRESVVAHLGDEKRGAYHRELAVALEGDDVPADPESLAAHWLGAADKERAVVWTIRAARAAEAAVAFDRAARLYLVALDLLAETHPDHRELTVRLGDALANSGRGKEASAAYLSAVAGASAAEALDLRRKAAEQLLRTGSVAEGVAALRDVLAAVGLRYPKTHRQALLGFLFGRARIRLRGVGFRERDASQVAPEVLVQIDACWAASGGLAVVDTLRGVSLQGQHLLLALKAGEPYRVARALAVEAGYLAALAPSRRDHAHRLLERSQGLASRGDHPYAVAVTRAIGGVVAYLEGSFCQAWETFQEVDSTFRELPGTTWERSLIAQYAAVVLFYLGRFRVLAARALRAVREAQERGDLFAAKMLRALALSFAELAVDRPDAASDQVDAAQVDWPKKTWLTAYCVPMQRARIGLYRQQAREAQQQTETLWETAVPIGCLRQQNLCLEIWHLRGACDLASALESSSPSHFLRRAENAAARVERQHMAWATPLAHLLRAGVARQRGEKEKCIAALDAAVNGFTLAEMALYASAAQRRKGQLVGGDDGEALIVKADESMAKEGIANPARMTSMLAPGFPES